jgi:type I restriction enzyme, S subunit
VIEVWSEAGWPVVRLGEIADIWGGGTPSRKRADFYAGDIPWLTGQDIPEDGVSEIISSRQFVTQEAIEHSATRLVGPGCVLMTTRVTVGKIAIARVPLCFSQDVTGIASVDHDVLDPYFLAQLLVSQREKFLGRNQGSTITGITRDNLQREIVPIPAISEQRRIGQALLEYGRLADLRVSAAVLASQLLPALFRARFCLDEAPKITPLAAIAEVVSGVALGRQIRGAGVQEVPYIRVANVQAGHLDLTEIKKTKASEREIDAFALRPGDVLMTEGGDYDKLGRGCLWSGEIEPCIHQNHVFRVRPEPKRLRSRFFAEYLQSAEAKHYFLRCAKRTTNLASINLTQLKALPVPVVSLKEQERFEREVESAMALGSDRADSLFRELRLSLMSLGFSGALTRGWRERNAATLREEIAERDRILSAAVRADAGLVVTFPFFAFELRSNLDGLTAWSAPSPGNSLGLTSDHARILEAFESLSMSSNVNADEQVTHHTAADIARTIRGNLRNDVQAVEGCVKVLDALGLVVAVSRPQRDPATNATVFGTCYRLPERSDESESDGSGAPATMEDPRGEAMAVLMAARERT